MALPRLTRITTELGGVVTFTLDRPLPCSGETAGANQVRSARHCFPAFIAPDHGQAGFGLQHRYVVTQMISQDSFAGNVPEITGYTCGPPVHAYAMTPGVPDIDGHLAVAVAGGDRRCPCRTWNDFRGHESVEVEVARCTTRTITTRSS